MVKKSARYLKGEATRARVLGEEHIKSRFEASGDFAQVFQEMVASEFVWGDIWSRPGLDLKARSMCTVAMLAALGRLFHLRVHLRGALNNGVTEDEIREILLQVGVYGGMPAASDGFRVAREVIEEYHAAKKKKSRGKA